jgi:uncharacterized protein (TIGR02231 family)
MARSTARSNTVRLAPVALLVFAVSTRAADVNANLVISKVTVHRSSAIITRAGMVELPTGDHRIIVRNLPDGLTPASIRLSAASKNLRLGGIEVQRITQDALVNEKERELQRQARAINDQRDAINDDIAVADSQLRLLGAVAQSPAGGAAVRVDGAELNSLVGSVGAGESAARTRIREGKIKIRELDAKLAALAEETQKVATARKSTTELRASVRVTAEGAVPFELEYQMAEAGWGWQYEARLDSQSKKVALIRQAELRQGTGEDWSNVELVVSTSRPVINAGTPRVAALFLGLDSPYTASGSGSGEELDEVVVTGFRASRARRYSPPRRGPERNEGSFTAQAGIPATADKEEADVFATDFVADYRIAGRVTVVSDRQAHLYPIGDEDLSIELLARVNLAASRNAHLEAKGRYRGEVPIDSGVVQLFRDDTFVGVASLPLVLPDDELRIPFGVDDRIRVTMREERTESGERGLTGKYQLDEHKRQFQITSFHANAIPLEVIDRIPVPRNDDIKVEVLEDATPPDVKDLDGMQGVYLWKFAGTPRKTETIRHLYSVRYPREYVLVSQESR